MLGVGYIGYLECDECSKIVYIKKQDDITIWIHPDDPNPLAEAACQSCGNTVQARIEFDHMVNFKRRGCKVLPWNDRFTELTEELIESWNIEDELGALV